MNGPVEYRFTLGDMVSYISCFHGRPRVSEVFLSHCSDLGILDRISAVVTIGDSENIALLQQFEVNYIECPNEPLGAKHNAGLAAALVREDGATHFMVLPSDDLISPEWKDACTGYDYATVPSCVVLDPVKRQAKVLLARPGGRMKFGACRVFSRKVIDRVGMLWTDHRVRALDMNSDGKVRAAGFELKVAKIRGPSFVDIKTHESLWGFDTWSGDPIIYEDALWMCSSSVVGKIHGLSTSKA